MRQGEAFCCAYDVPPEVVSVAQHWCTSPVWMEKPAARSGSIKRNVPQSNVTGPNNINVVTGNVFGNSGKNTALIRGEVSVTLSVLLTLAHISAPKTASVPSKKTLTHKCLSPSTIVMLYWQSWKQSPLQSALPTETSVNFPLENSLPPREGESHTAYFLLMWLWNYVI